MSLNLIKLSICFIMLNLLISNMIYSDKILSIFDMIEKKCYGNKTKKMGICTTRNICHFGIYQPFLYVDEHMEISGFECNLGEICCTKGCLVKGYYVGICISREECLNQVYENFKTIKNEIVFGEKCYFNDVCCI